MTTNLDSLAWCQTRAMLLALSSCMKNNEASCRAVPSPTSQRCFSFPEPPTSAYTPSDQLSCVRRYWSLHHVTCAFSLNNTPLADTSVSPPYVNHVQRQIAALFSQTDDSFCYCLFFSCILAGIVLTVGRRDSRSKRGNCSVSWWWGQMRRWDGLQF